MNLNIRAPPRTELVYYRQKINFNNEQKQIQFVLISSIILNLINYDTDYGHVIHFTVIFYITMTLKKNNISVHQTNINIPSYRIKICI